MTENTEKRISMVKEWKITVTVYTDGTSDIHREGIGFLAHELLGLLDLTREDILCRLRESVTPQKTEVVVHPGTPFPEGEERK